MISKKLLVAFSPANPGAKSSDFLVPVLDEGVPRFIGLTSRMATDLGMMVYVGRDVSTSDILTKLMDSGRQIKSVDETMKSIETYLQMLQDHKIGNIIALEPSRKDAVGFELKKVANTPSAAMKASGIDKSQHGTERC